MDSVLFAVHRIPFPPNKGDKIRSFQILKALSSAFNVTVVCFVDDKKDMIYEKELYRYADNVYVEYISKPMFYLRAFSAFIRGISITESVYCSTSMKSKVNELIDNNNIKNILAYSSSMGKYFQDHKDYKNTVIDFVDVDSSKWKEYSIIKGFFIGFPYRREARLLAELECQLHNIYDVSTFVTRSEKNHFELLCNDERSKNIVNSNGVNTDYFDPDITYENPYSKLGLKDIKPICFVGAMDYYANENAAIWFMDKVLPRIVELNPKSVFFIVGRNPSSKLKTKSLNTPGSFVTGAVADVRPYLRYSRVVVAPLQIARGIQNKVLEALSMDKRVVGTRVAIEGIVIDNRSDCLVSCDNAESMIEEIIVELEGKNEHTQDSRVQVINNYSWTPKMNDLLSLFK